MSSTTPTIEDLRALRALLADAPGTVNCSLVRFDHELDTLKVKCGSLQVSSWVLNALKSAGYEVTRANDPSWLRAVYYVTPPRSAEETPFDRLVECITRSMADRGETDVRSAVARDAGLLSAARQSDLCRAVLARMIAPDSAPTSYADHRTYVVAMPISDDRLDHYSRRGVLLSRDAAHEVVASISRDRHELLARGGEANIEAAERLDSLRRRIMEAMR